MLIVWPCVHACVCVEPKMKSSSETLLLFHILTELTIELRFLLKNSQ